MSSARTTLVAQLAPVSPPCFSARDIWVEYLKSAVEYGRADHPSPLAVERGQPPRFNYDYNFCADCSAPHAAEMAKRDLCKPLHLRILGLKVIPIVVVAVTPSTALPRVADADFVVRDKLPSNRKFIRQVVGEGRGQGPLRTIAEMADELGISAGSLRGYLRMDPEAPKHAMQQTNNGAGTTVTYFKPAEVRHWWAARQAAAKEVA